MEMYFFRHDLYEKLHNCSVINIDSIPLETRKHPKTGFILMTMAITLELLYIPCLISLHRHANNPCYKIMRYIGIVDILIIPVNGILTGWMAMQGDVFCSKPTFIYFVGSVTLGLYCSVSISSVILAVNRCLEMIYPSFNEVLFTPKLVIFWLLVSSLYGLYFTIFTIPIKFTGIYLSWFFHPYAGYTNDQAELYHNPMHTMNNVVESSSLICMYTIFVIVILVRSCGTKSVASSHSNAKRRSQIRSFLQVFLISTINVVACSIYVLMNFVPLSEFLIILGQFCWLFIHGLPPLIYLTLNRTIRRDTIKMLGLGTCCAGNNVKPARTKTTTASDLHVHENHEVSEDENVM